MDIIVTGSIAYDYLMRFPGHFTDHLIAEQLHQISVSFLVEDMTKHWGGIAANIAFNAALLGLQPRLMGTVGRDFPDYQHWLESVGVDTSTVRQIDEVFTASFFANTDLANNQIASFYAGAMTYAKDFALADVYDGKPDLVIISPNDPDAMLNLAYECRQRDIRFVADPSQQIARFDRDQLNTFIADAFMLIVNAYEAEAICQKTNRTVDDLREEFDLLVITQGERGTHIYDRGRLINVPTFPPRVIKDPTGAGDAFRGGFLRGLAASWPLEFSGQVGNLCATLALEHVGTQNHRFSPQTFIERFREKVDDEGRLDALLVPIKSNL